MSEMVRAQSKLTHAKVEREVERDLLSLPAFVGINLLAQIPSVLFTLNNFLSMNLQHKET